MVALAVLPAQAQVPDVTPLNVAIFYVTCWFALLLGAALIALMVVVPGTDSDDRAAVIRELKEMFLGFFKELVSLFKELVRSLGAQSGPADPPDAG